MKRKPYKRLECSCCGKAIPPEHLETNPMEERMYVMFPKVDKKPIKEFHRTMRVHGSGADLIGSRTEPYYCGPVKEVEIGLQQQWVEHLVEIQDPKRW